MMTVKETFIVLKLSIYTKQMPENSIGLNFYTVLIYKEGMIPGCLRTNSVDLAGLRSP